MHATIDAASDEVESTVAVDVDQRELPRGCEGFRALGDVLDGNPANQVDRRSVEFSDLVTVRDTASALQAIQMIHAHTGASGLTAGERREALEPGDIAIFPLAFPVIAGPAGLTAVVLLMGQAAGDPLQSAVVLGATPICLMLTYFGMIATEILHRVLRTTGTNVIGRLSGVVLAALAVQFIFDGIRGARLLAP